MRTSIEIENIQTKSFEIIFKSCTWIGLIIEVIPKTAKILNMFEPIRLPKEIAFSFLIIAIMEAESSGILVPMEIIEIPITRSLTPIRDAKDTAPLTKVSDPNHKAKPPANMY